MRRSSEWETGKELELDILGYGVKPAAYYEEGKYVPFQKAVDLVRRNQVDGWDPEDPPLTPATFPGDIYYLTDKALQKKLAEALETDEPLAAELRRYAGGGKLKFFSATGSPLDRLHGIDAFLELDFYDSDNAHARKTVLATLDVTKNPEKAHQDVKADVLAYLPNGYEALPSAERERIANDIAQRAADVLVDKLHTHRVSRNVSHPL